MTESETWPSATKFIEVLAGDQRSTVIDSECVDSVSDYKDVIEELLRDTTAGEVTLTEFDGVEGARRKLVIALNGGARHAFDVEGDTDWLDVAAVVGVVQRALQGIGYGRRFFAYHCSEFGQEVGFATVPEVGLANLIRFGRLENRSLTLYLGADDVLEPASEDMGGDPEIWEAALARFAPGAPPPA